MENMDRRMFAASALSAAVGLASVAAATTPARAAMGTQQMGEMEKKLQHETMVRMKTEHLVKCYGINAVGRNDCAAGAHSCAGQATKARDPASFVLLPKGDCGKIAGGSLKAS
ncbi:MAG: BufA1 family periplasmic bufferin-type metallophore [Acetobacteraceae bacterium]